MRVFDEEFDMQGYIQKRLLEVEDLESRRVFKDIVGKLFLELHDEIEKEYTALEARVFEEVPMSLEGPEVLTNINARKNYDVTDAMLLPMRQEDLIERQINSEDLMDSLKRSESFFLYTIFLRADYLEVAKFDNARRIFRGVIRTEHSEFTAQFFVRPNTFYREKIENLYEIFQINYLPWRSVCAPYLFKLFDIHIASIENWDPKETILEARIDFEEYQWAICYDQIPLWNVRPVSVKTSTYPEPCVDKTNFEHRIFRHKLKADARYLVTNQDAEISNIRWLNGDLLITCPEDSPVTWQLYQFNAAAEPKYENPMMSNGQTSTFAARLRGRFTERIKTKQEIARLLASMKAADALEFVGVELVHAPVQKETYCVDWFIADELRNGKWEMALRLDFRAKDQSNCLNRDMMSFLVGIVQRYFPEYECCARLV